MRRVLLMVFAIVMLMAVGTVGAAQAKGGSSKDKSRCETSGHRGANSGPGKCGDAKCPSGSKRHGRECRPEPCPEGSKRHGRECRPEPCPEGSKRHGDECRPDPEPCPEGTVRIGDDDDCVPVVPPPAEGPCSKADLILLRALIEGTGPLDTLVCLFFGDNAVNASNQAGGNCPGALIALPIDSLVGVCVLVPPEGGSTPGAGLPELPAPPGLPEAGGLPDASMATGLLDQVTATVGGLLHG